MSKEKWPFDQASRYDLSEVLEQLDSENIDAYGLVEWEDSDWDHS